MLVGLSDSFVVTPATCLGILNFLFHSKRITHKKIGELCLCRTSPTFLIECVSRNGEWDC